MMKIAKWQIWSARVRFEDSNEIKNRPVLIINHSVAYIIAFKMTGTDRGDNSQEYRIVKWENAGLSKRTSIRLGKVLKLEKMDLIQFLGKLDPYDIFRLERRLL